MIEVMPGSEGNKLILRARSKLTDQDYKEVLIPKLETIIQEHGKARLLLDMGDDFQGWEPGALWDDAHFGMTHRNDFEKMGVVGGPEWVDWGLNLATVIMSGDIKNFSASERDEALRWLDT